jgi:hypothetical protein
MSLSSRLAQAAAVRQDGYTQEQATAAMAFQRWAEVELSKPNFDAIRKVMLMARSQSMSLAQMKNEYYQIVLTA